MTQPVYTTEQGQQIQEATKEAAAKAVRNHALHVLRLSPQTAKELANVVRHS